MSDVKAFPNEAICDPPRFFNRRYPVLWAGRLGSFCCQRIQVRAGSARLVTTPPSPGPSCLLSPLQNHYLLNRPYLQVLRPAESRRLRCACRGEPPSGPHRLAWCARLEEFQPSKHEGRGGGGRATLHRLLMPPWERARVGRLVGRDRICHHTLHTIPIRPPSHPPTRTRHADPRPQAREGDALHLRKPG